MRYASGILAFGLLLHAVPSFADLHVCNKTQQPLSFAYAWRQEPTSSMASTISWGWWNIDPGKCELVAPFDSTQETSGSAKYYYYAHSSEGAWEGDLKLCVKLSGDFSEIRIRAMNEQGCTGGELRGFRPLGLTQPNSTLNLDKLH